MMERFVFLVLLALLLAMTAIARAQQPQAGWIVDAQTGCRMWDPYPEPDDSIKWDGPCLNGYGHGRGTLRWFSKGNNYETDEGEFQNGKLNGYAVVRLTSGRRFEGQFRDQKPNGFGTLSTEDGQVYSGEWSNGCFQQGERRATFNATKEECGFP